VSLVVDEGWESSVSWSILGPAEATDDRNALPSEIGIVNSAAESASMGLSPY